MPSSPTSAPVTFLVCGDDEFAVKIRAKEIYRKWTEEFGGMDHEILDAAVANGGEALQVINRLREALNTLPFFGGAKVVWLQNCNYLGDDRTAGSAVVTEAMGDLARLLKEFKWDNVRLLVSAGKVDKRKVFYKTIEKIGGVEILNGWSVDDKDWMDRAQNAAEQQLKGLGKDIAHDALRALAGSVGPNSRLLSQEVEKLALFVGERRSIKVSDVTMIVTRNKQARAFALGDAFGDRDLPKVLKCLDEELWEMKFDRQKSEIGLLYGLIGKVRTMLLCREMSAQGWVKGGQDYSRFKSQLERVPAGVFPEDRRFNPLSMHPFVLHRSLDQSKNYSLPELVAAMDILLKCNLRLVSSGLDEALVLQQALVQIVAASQAGATSKRTGPNQGIASRSSA